MTKFKSLVMDQLISHVTVFCCVFFCLFSGMVLVFDHTIMHEGSELKKGRKYSMRTDVMYSAEPIPKT